MDTFLYYAPNRLSPYLPKLELGFLLTSTIVLELSLDKTLLLLLWEYFVVRIEDFFFSIFLIIYSVASFMLLAKA